MEDSRSGTPSMSRHRSETLLSPVENFARLGLLSPRLVAVHMTQLTDHEIQLLAAAKGVGHLSALAGTHTHTYTRV